MFYPLGLLHHPNRVVLNLAWVAATRGTKSITRDQLDKCDVAKLCKTILRFLQSQSSDPKKRFSLRLSAMFVHGALLIWGKQVVYLQNIFVDDVFLMIKSRQDESYRRDVMLKDQKETTQESAKTLAAAKKKRKVTKKIMDTPESLIEISERMPAIVDELSKQIKDTGIAQTSPDVTMIQPEARQWTGDPFPLTADVEVEGLLQDARQPLPHKIVVEALVHRPAELEEPLSTVQAQVPLPTVQPEVSVPPVQPEDAIVPMPEETVIPEKQPVVPEEMPQVFKTPSKKRSVESESSESVTSRREYRKKTFADKLAMKTSQYRFPAIIDKDWTYVEKEFPIGFEGPLGKFIPSKKFWPDLDLEFRVGEVTVEPRGTDLSDVPSYSIRDASTPRVSALSKGVSLLDSHARPVTSTPVDKTIIHEIAPAAHNGLLMSPAKRRRLAPVVRVEDIEPFKVPEPPLPVMLPEDLPPEVPAEIAHEQLPKKKLPSTPRAEFGQKWYSEIIGIIHEHFSIKPVDICKILRKRVSRSNMAIIFATLLVLCERQLVLLRTVPGSSELDIVEKA
ncbi:unnamed protein product [Ceutorhynchus assimilis]|uniref:Rad21/Rec8-like protein N-terminal domain-containing protein n=1 Tax=Ceutorhynchus assimilis TaxID=467358 RepID=A0A9P0GJZ3_9CUCU|nr:unnamed protein product [Ceutorhynchus assimilis]